MKAKGRGLEAAMEFTNAEYKSRQIAIIEKVEVPKTFSKARGIVIYLKKTGFDYEGVLYGGRAVCIEAKENEKTSLPYIDYGKKGDGLKAHQLDALIQYGSYGAFVGIVWNMKDIDKYYFIDFKNLKLIKSNILNERKSIPRDYVLSKCKEIPFVNGRLDYLCLLK